MAKLFAKDPTAVDPCGLEGDVVYRFADQTTSSLPVLSVLSAATRQYARMAASDDPELKAAGHAALLRQASEGLQAMIAHDTHMALLERKRLQPVEAARKPRRKKALRAAILELMRREKLSGSQFKTFLSRWEHEPIDGLALTGKGPFVVTDEDGDNTQTGSYTYGSLASMWSSKPEATDKR